MFPIRDENPTLRTPYATFTIITLNVAVWVLFQGMGSEPILSGSVCQHGLIPGEFLHRLPIGYEIPMGRGMSCVVTGGLSWTAPLTSMFLHGSWLHLIGNMWFLWIFGNNVEDVMGRGRYVLFYLLCGFAAVAAQTASSPSSAVPMVGASGAIGGVMGSYILLYPHARIRTFVFLFFLDVPAFVMLGYWFVLQLVGGSLPQEGGGTAFWAHVGGFATGIFLTPLFRDPELLANHRRAAHFL